MIMSSRFFFITFLQKTPKNVTTYVVIQYHLMTISIGRKNQQEEICYPSFSQIELKRIIIQR